MNDAELPLMFEDMVAGKRASSMVLVEKKEVAESPVLAVVAVVAFPDKAPENVGAITVSVNLPVPATSSLYVGVESPIPTLPVI